MDTLSEILEQYQIRGITVTISSAIDFRDTRGRFPKDWLAYSLSMPGTQPVMPITAFACIGDLERDLRCKLRAMEPKQHIPAKSGAAKTKHTMNMIGAKKIEMKYARRGIFCTIAPASTWPPSRIAALKAGQNPDEVWGLSVYVEATKSWTISDEAFYSLRNVAGALATIAALREEKEDGD